MLYISTWRLLPPAYHTLCSLPLASLSWELSLCHTKRAIHSSLWPSAASAVFRSLCVNSLFIFSFSVHRASLSSFIHFIYFLSSSILAVTILWSVSINSHESSMSRPGRFLHIRSIYLQPIYSRDHSRLKTHFRVGSSLVAAQLATDPVVSFHIRDRHPRVVLRLFQLAATHTKSATTDHPMNNWTTTDCWHGYAHTIYTTY